MQALLMEQTLACLTKYNWVKEKLVFESLYKVISENQVYYHKLHTLVQIITLFISEAPLKLQQQKAKNLLCVTVE